MSLTLYVLYLQLAGLFLKFKIHLGSCTDWQVACTSVHIPPNFSNLKYKKSPQLGISLQMCLVSYLS